MKEKHIQPNLQTFHSVLMSLYRMTRNPMSANYALMTLREMVRIGIGKIILEQEGFACSISK